jgi:DNA-binding response OmpR family regulator
MNKKILLIEDDQLVANIYRNKFCCDNFDVEVAHDGAAGFDAITTFKPNVVILDLMLPTITGLDLLKKIRAHEDLKQLPVIVFSNTYLSNMVQEAWKAGATKCLSKASCTPKQVIDVVRSLVGSSDVTPAPAHAVPAAAPLVDSEADAAFQDDLRRSFLEALPACIAACRAHLQSAIRSAGEEQRVKYLQELYRRVHTITGNAGMAGVVTIAQMTDALEALIKELYEKPKNINASTLRTVALTVDFLNLLFERTPIAEPKLMPSPAKPNILVVDDEAISRRAITYALEKAKLASSSVENPEAALTLLAENKYDLVFLDVDMPGMNGFELCTKLRGFQRNHATPVVFVTGLTDFESRANSTMSGGNDLIAKPFLFMELAVKALVYVLRGRMAPAAKAAPTLAAA